jgi:hypothetical protein
MASEVASGSKVTIGAALSVGAAAISVAISIAVSDARTEARLEAASDKISYITQKRDEIENKVNIIDARTARIEGILEEMRRNNEK